MEKTIKVQKLFWNALTLCGVVLFLGLFYAGYRQGLFTSKEALGRFLSVFGFWAPFLFIGLQIMQVVVPVVPGGLTLAAGVLLFGPLWGFFYNYIGIAVGSVFNFLLARRYGRSFVRNMAPEKLFQKYVGWLDEKGRFERMFAVAIFLPVAPDDFLCMLAGLTSMSLRHFVTIIVLCKPASIFAYSIGLTALLQKAMSVLPVM